MRDPTFDEIHREDMEADARRERWMLDLEREGKRQCECGQIFTVDPGAGPDGWELCMRCRTEMEGEE